LVFHVFVGLDANASYPRLSSKIGVGSIIMAPRVTRSSCTHATSCVDDDNVIYPASNVDKLMVAYCLLFHAMDDQPIIVIATNLAQERRSSVPVSERGLLLDKKLRG